MQIKQITFANKNGDTITINKTGTYRLTGTFVTSGLESTTFATSSYMQHGRTFFNSTYKEDDMTLSFMIFKKGMTVTDEKNARKTLQKVFAPHLGVGSLTVTLEDNTYYVRDCSVDVAPFFPTGFDNNNNMWQNVVIELVANNPFWAGPSVSVPFNNNTGGTGTGFVTVTNDGQASTGFVMDFKATGTGTFHIVKDVPGPINPEIQIFGVNNTDIIHIDTRYGGKTVQVNGVTRWDLVAPNSNFFELDQGDNVILCEQVHNTGTITFNPKYIGF